MKIIQDIIRAKKNDINHEPEENVIHPSPLPPQNINRVVYHHQNTGHSKKGIWIIAIVAVLILFFALSFFFAGANIKITPKVYRADMDNDFTAKKEATDGELPFEIMSLKGEESMTVQGGEQKNVSKKAIGRVIVYNKFSKTPQKLLINTRLESANGQIYKTDTAVVIPGYTTQNSEIIPGSIETGVTADIAGTAGNTEMTDFTIPGFKGTSKYDKFFARSKTSINGGITGMVYSVSEEESTKIKDDILASLHAKLLKQAGAQVPKGYVLYPNASYFITDNEPSIGDSENKNIQISQKGTLYAFLFDRAKLSTSIAKIMVSQYDGAQISIPDISSLEFTLKNTDQISPENSSQVIFHLRGQADIVWSVDVKSLAKEFVNKRKSDMQSILSLHKNIDRAEVTIRPFWKRTFPDDSSKINIINTVNNG